MKTTDINSGTEPQKTTSEAQLAAATGYADACRMIHDSISIDFRSPLEWGQWCRRVASAAVLEDHDLLAALKSDQAARVEGSNTDIRTAA